MQIAIPAHVAWRMWVSVTVALAAPALLLTGCAADSGGSPGDSQSPHIARADIGDGHYRATRIRGHAPELADFGSHGLTVWFERQNGRMTLIADGPFNTWNMPVDLHGAVINPDPKGAAVSLVGCASASSTCTTDAWVGRFIAKPMTYKVEGAELVLTSDGTEVDLQRT